MSYAIGVQVFVKCLQELMAETLQMVLLAERDIIDDVLMLSNSSFFFLSLQVFL
jgi:hypothetical protein